ncbi:hypothetical protein L4C36_16275 [Photobacterium japonica]|uniref:hypothetical protein n=1 Tax=Photobacterium japonica TaxID=2910235 RepID=UPI003D0A5ACF
MNNTMKLGGIVTMAAVMSACTTSPSNHAQAQSMGWLHGNCLAIKQADLPAASPITLIHLNETHLDGKYSEEHAVITRPSNRTDTCYAQFANRAQVNTEAGYHFYQVRTRQPVNFAIGIVGTANTSNKMAYSYCHTREGITFTAADNEKTVWQGAYYLGYDALPTCKTPQ